MAEPRETHPEAPFASSPCVNREKIHVYEVFERINGAFGCINEGSVDINEGCVVIDGVPNVVAEGKGWNQRCGLCFSR